MTLEHSKFRPKSIALVVNQNEIFYRLRMPWIRILKENGYKVYAVVADGDWSERIEEGGAEFVEWKLSRSGRNPFSELRSIIGLARILRRIKPDIVQNFHTKPNIYSPIAARLAGVPISVTTVTGLGYTFVDRPGIRSRIGRWLNFRMYAFANRLADRVMFQNPDDMNDLKSAGALNSDKGEFLPGGSGVDVAEYYPNSRDSARSIELRKSLGVPKDNFVVMFAGRLQLDKGLIELVEAAKIVNRKRSDISFLMVGAPDPGNKRSVSNSQLDIWKSEADVILTGRREDVPDLMAMADVVVAPTFYREGLPRTLLEAAATGLPLIGTDVPGVREAISDGVNGILIEARNELALANAVEELADDQEKAHRYGKASLERAHNEFDYRNVVGGYLNIYESLWSGRM